MAKKKKKSSTKRRRHHVGALSMNASSPIVMLGSVALGYFGGTAINQALNMIIPASMKTQAYTGKAVAAGQVGLGALLVLGKGKKSLIKTVAGGLLAGAGLKRAMVVFAPNTTDTLGGYGDIPVIGAYAPPSQINGRRRVNGYGSIPVIGGYNPESSLTGTPSKVMGSVDAACMSSGYMN